MKTRRFIKIFSLICLTVVCYCYSGAQFFVTGGYQDGGYASGGEEVYVNIPAIPPVTQFESFPNPFLYINLVRFTLEKPSQVTLSVVDLNNRPVMTLIGAASLKKGIHEVTWNRKNADGHPVPAGVYFYRMTTGAGQFLRKVVCL